MTTTITKSDLAALCGTTTKTLENWVKRGLIPQPQKINGRSIFDLHATLSAVVTKQLKLTPAGFKAYRASIPQQG